VQSVKANSHSKSTIILMKYSTMENASVKLLWKMFHEGMTDQTGVFLNVDIMKMNAVGM